MIKVRFIRLVNQFHHKVIEVDTVPRVGEYVQFQSSKEAGNISKVVAVLHRPYAEEECRIDITVKDDEGLFLTNTMVPLNQDEDPRVTLVASENH